MMQLWLSHWKKVIYHLLSRDSCQQGMKRHRSEKLFFFSKALSGFNEIQAISKNGPFPVSFLQPCMRPSGGNKAPWKSRSDSGVCTCVLSRQCAPWVLASTSFSCCSPLAWFIPVSLASVWTILESSALVLNCEIDIVEYRANYRVRKSMQVWALKNQRSLSVC